jgi:hypothetical protein
MPADSRNLARSFGAMMQYLITPLPADNDAAAHRNLLINDSSAGFWFPDDLANRKSQVDRPGGLPREYLSS